MTPQQILQANAGQAAKFLVAGQNVDQAHLRLALANALRKIDDLERQLATMVQSKPQDSAG